MIVQAAQDGDKLARETLQQIGYWLGIGVANLINILNPDRAAMGQRGLTYERLDQLTVEILLGVR